MTHRPFSAPWLLALIVVVAAFAGCATPAQTAHMVANDTVPEHRSSNNVSIEVSGGSEQSAVAGPAISNADFAAAIRESILASGLFAAIAQSEQSDYRLTAYITRVQQPMVGFAMTVTFECSWRLIRSRDGATVWEKAITTNFTGNVGDALVGATRVRLATEGAARNNIKDAILAMGRLGLK